MYILRIEHAVFNYEGWKMAFDNDSVWRQEAGVCRYRLMRPVNDSDYVMIDLEFDTASEAEAMLEALLALWAHIEGKIIMDPQAEIVRMVESGEA